MKLRALAIAGAMAASFAISNPVYAALALDVTPGGGRAGTDTRAFTLGWSFSVDSPITLGSLGLWDQGSDGLGVSHLVRLWTAGGALLASATIDNTDNPVASALSEGRWLMEDIAPVILGVGRYVIGADGNAGDWDLDPFRVDGQTITTIAEITYGQSRYSNAGTLGLPTNNDASGERGYQGPTFGTVPEPGTLALLGVVLAGLAASRRRKQ